MRGLLRMFPPWLLVLMVVTFIEGEVGRAYGCVIPSPPGFVCLRQWAVPVPALVPPPLDVFVAWAVPAALLWALWVSGREGVYELLGGALGRFARKTVHADPYALFGTVDQRGLRPPGWTPPAGEAPPAGFEGDGLLAAAAQAFDLVQTAWAHQDPMVARGVLSTPAWSVLSVLIDESRRRRRGGIVLAGLAVVDQRVLRLGEVDGQPAAVVRLAVRCDDPPTSCEQDWTFVRPLGGGGWLVAAVDPVPAARAEKR